MKLFKSLAVFAIALIINLTPIVVGAAGLVPCGGAGEEACQACHVTQLINRVVAWLIIVLSIVATILIVVAGFKLVTQGGNSGAVKAAKDTFVNIFIGFLLILGGWLLIDTLMKALVKDQVYGMWNEIQCLAQPTVSSGPANSGALTVGPAGTNPGVGVAGGGRGTGAQCNAGNNACSVSALTAAGYNEQQANIMSCIAMTESSGNPAIGPYNTRNPGSNSTACGTFQITGTTWRGVTRGQGACGNFSQCTNLDCNMQVAQQLVQRNGYRDWTCPNCNNSAQGCISRYGG